jgi:hypothetical protein
MLLTIVLKLVPAIVTTALASLVNAAVLAVFTRGQSAAEPSRITTRRQKPARSRRPRRAQKDLVSLRRRAPRRVG